MKYVVIYYSHTGNNRNLALELQRRLDCDCVEVTEAGRRSRLTILLDVLLSRKPAINWERHDFGAYDKAVLVAPVWAGHIASPLAAFLAREKDRLPGFAFISLCSGVPGQPERIADELHRLTGRLPELVEQLNVNELLPPEHRHKVRYTSAYRAGAQDMAAFSAQIEHFVQELEPVGVPSGTPSPGAWRGPAPSGSRSP